MTTTDFYQEALKEAQKGYDEGGIPNVVICENQTFMGEEALLKSRGVKVEALQENDSITLMQRFISEQPSLWNEDIGV